MIDALPERITRHIWPEPNSGCWLWGASTDPNGYGQARHPTAGRTARVHRLAYEAARGPIPAGLSVLHRCDNPPCCNPDHLFLGTRAENVADMVSKGRQRRGEGRSDAVLTEAAVLDIRRRRAAGERIKSIAASHGIPENTARTACFGGTWAHLPGIVATRDRRGSHHGMAKLTEADVVAIRARSPRGGETRAVASEYGISASTVRDICQRRFWKHVP